MQSNLFTLSCRATSFHCHVGRPFSIVMSSDRRESRHLYEDFSFRPVASLEMTYASAPTSRPVLSGFRRFRSDIPLRLRRGDAKAETSTFARTSSAWMLISAFAERTGFEPVSRFRRLHAFQACLFSHSSIFPLTRQKYEFPAVLARR